MPITTVNEPVVNEEVWNAWIQEGRRSNAARDRNLKFLIGIVLALFAMGVGWYLLTLK